MKKIVLFLACCFIVSQSVVAEEQPNSVKKSIVEKTVEISKQGAVNLQDRIKKSFFSTSNTILQDRWACFFVFLGLVVYTKVQYALSKKKKKDKDLEDEEEKRTKIA